MAINRMNLLRLKHHSSHGPQSNRLLSPTFLFALWSSLALPSLVHAETCITATCHANLGAFKEKHAPVAKGECLACHVRKSAEHPVKGGKSFALAAKGGALCAMCHKGIGKLRYVHVPVREGDCLSCHNPHGASKRNLIEVGDDQNKMCLPCHDGLPTTERYLHGPFSSGECTTCHSPHDSDERFLLKKKEKELCFTCHSEFPIEMQKAGYIHPPVKEKPCASCHNPHGSSAPHILKQKLPDLCIKCHQSMGRKLKLLKTPHKPVVEGKLCRNCHSSHFSKGRGLLPEDRKGLCLGCHNTENLGNPPLRNIAKELAGKKSLHGPIQKGSCSGCHDPHGSNFSKGLLEKYPEGTYAPFADESYDLCLKCHKKNLLRFADTSIYTEFRNGKRNLHYVHVADRVKGHTCRACHEIHASNGAKLISEEGVPFGQWKILLHFEKTATGGSCAPGCHRRYAYDRDKPVDYSVAPRKLGPVKKN